MTPRPSSQRHGRPHDVKVVVAGRLLDLGDLRRVGVGQRDGLFTCGDVSECGAETPGPGR